MIQVPRSDYASLTTGRALKYEIHTRTGTIYNAKEIAISDSTMTIVRGMVAMDADAQKELAADGVVLSMAEVDRISRTDVAQTYSLAVVLGLVVVALGIAFATGLRTGV